MSADLTRFHRAVRDGRLLSRSSLTEMENLTPVSVRERGTMTSGYGLGYEMKRLADENLTLWGHSGGYYGSATFWYYAPELDAYVTLNTNSAVRAADANREIYLPIFRYLRQQQTAGKGTASPALNMTGPALGGFLQEKGKNQK